MSEMRFKVSVDAISNLVNKVSVLSNGSNSIQFTIGMKSNGKGLLCQAAIVNGGQMLTVGFVTEGVPAEYEDGQPLQFAVKAKTLCDYLSRLLALEADMTFTVKEGKTLVIGVSSTAKVSLPLTSECETLLVNDVKDALVKAEVKTADFLALLKRGGYAAIKDEDELRKTDRVVLAFEKYGLVCLSSDGHRVAYSRAEGKVGINEQMNALSFFKPDERRAYVDKVMSKKMSETEYFDTAKTKGYMPGSAKIALTSDAVGVILKAVTGGAEVLTLMVTFQKLHITCGNVKLLLVLAGEVPGFCEVAIKQFSSLNWQRFSVDKGALANALGVISLSCDGAKVPVKLEVKKGNLLVADDSGNQIKVKVIEGAEGTEGLDAPMNVAFLNAAISKFSGNVVLGLTGNDREPLLISDGSVDGNGSTAKAYILKVSLAEKNAAGEAEKKEEKKDKKEKKSAKPSEAGADSTSSETSKTASATEADTGFAEEDVDMN